MKGCSFAQFADYAVGHAVGPRADPGEAECCVNCQHGRCLIDYDPDPSLRRCALEEYMYTHSRKKRRGNRQPPAEYLTTVQVARLRGIRASSVSKACLQGRYPGARKRGRAWMIPAEVIR